MLTSQPGWATWKYSCMIYFPGKILTRAELGEETTGGPDLEEKSYRRLEAQVGHESQSFPRYHFSCQPLPNYISDLFLGWG